MSETIYEMLIRHEGLRKKPYRDTAGKLTIGVGRNLDDVGISEGEAFNMLRADVVRARNGLRRYLPWWAEQPDAVRLVLENMCFQLGIHGLLKFERALAAIQSGHYARAAKEMLDSLWAKQTPNRAQELARIIAAQAG